MLPHRRSPNFVFFNPGQDLRDVPGTDSVMLK